jgi:hypothetical protein
MNILVLVFDFFKGRKTYLIGLLMIALGLLQNDMQMVLTGLGMMTLRAGIAGAVRAGGIR